MIEFILKGESHLLYVYCINRASEILTVGGIQGIFGKLPGTGATATGLLQQLELHNEAARAGIDDIMLDNSPLFDWTMRE